MYAINLESLQVDNDFSQYKYKWLCFCWTQKVSQSIHLNMHSKIVAPVYRSHLKKTEHLTTEWQMRKPLKTRTGKQQ